MLGKEKIPREIAREWLVVHVYCYVNIKRLADQENPGWINGMGMGDVERGGGGGEVEESKGGKEGKIMTFLNRHFYSRKPAGITLVAAKLDQWLVLVCNLPLNCHNYITIITTYCI